MENWTEVLNQGWIGALIGLVGVLFGVYQIIRRTGPRLCYQYGGQRLIEGSGALLPEAVTVSYEGAVVPRLSLTYIVVWNWGYGPIRADDVAPHDPIQFAFEDGEILRAEIVRCTRAANKHNLVVDKSSPNRLAYFFSFLDRGDGALIRLLHTSKVPKPRAEGTVIGLPRGVEDLGAIPLLVYNKAMSGLFPNLLKRTIVACVTAIVGFVIALLAGEISQIIDEKMPAEVFHIVGVFVLCYGLTGVVGFWWIRRRFPAALAPEYEENTLKGLS